MQIKFKVKTAELTGAIDTATLVTPAPVGPKGNEIAGYLFIVRGEKCYVYSSDSVQVARACFSIYDVEGEGAFIYPAQHANAFRSLGEEVAFEVVNEGDTHTVKYKGGSSAERTSVNPGLLSTCDKDLEGASEGQVFSVSLLREALGLVKPFIAKPDDKGDEQWKATQIFDGTHEGTAKGNGHLYASDSQRAFYFHCEAFRDKGLAIHGKHLGVLGAFLSKCEGNITVRRGTNMMFVIDSQERVLGWTHQVKGFTKFVYYPLKSDHIVLTVPVDTLLRALSYIRAEIPPKSDDYIKANFDAKGPTLTFVASDDKCKAVSFPVLVGVEQNPDNRDFSYRVSLGHFRNLFEGVKGKQVALRCSILAPAQNRPKESAMFRTIDEFWLDSAGKNVAGSGANKEAIPEGAVQCIATRFMPSMN